MSTFGRDVRTTQSSSDSSGMEIATNGFKRHAPSDKEHREPRAGLVHKPIERGISVTATGVRRACCSLRQSRLLGPISRNVAAILGWIRDSGVGTVGVRIPNPDP